MPTKDTVPAIAFLPPIEVTTTAQPLLAALNLPDGAQKGIMIKAPGPTDDTPNTTSVFLGSGASVTADQTSTGGFPLAPGESVSIPLEQITKLHCIVAAGTEYLNCMVL